ncbi:MAG: spermidine/putrescine ABC transporter substrate-binding protein [Oscillospiraceae bacterium]|jgi:spermidine/putrescine transport system substrate-binding protein|nr:spermidine/putrescine ABC transporter substrate-binding protein [Oscillospiraceae bacterium]
MMKKFAAVFLVLMSVLSLSLTAFADETTTAATTTTTPAEEKDYSHLEGTTLYVYNWGEYISDGSEGSLNVLAAFKEKYGITVQYSMYDSNEDLYAKLAAGGTNYDVIIPSDYMIARLVAENMLEKIDFDNIPNYQYIADEHKSTYFDPKNEYSVPYTVGMVGIIYNTKVVDGTPDSWSLMWDEKYSGQILNFNNPRDAFSTAQFLLGQDANSEAPADWEAAFEKLKEQKPLIQNYVMDEVFNKMEKGEAAIAPYYAGDFLSMADNNPDLAFFYPKEGTNIFMDSMCIPKGAANKEAAELFINFMLEPEIAVANADYICYASPNTAVLESDDYELKGNEYLYPAEGDKPETQYFHALPKTTLDLMNSYWNELGIAGSSNTALYIALAGVAVVVIAAFVFAAVRKKKRA